MYSVLSAIRLMLCYLLIFQLIFIPFRANAGAGVVIADPKAPIEFRPAIKSSERGTPVVDITRPSAGGVSRNQYDQFNVGESGLVLNNSTTDGVSVIGGRVSGNRGLVTPADVILNEVTSSNPSTLRGTTEVHGKKADVIIANPNGIACEGCGFRNTPKVDLTTGRVNVGADGKVAGIDVTSGRVIVGNGGLRALTAEEVRLSGKEVKIDGRVRVNSRGKFAVSAGSHNVDANDRVTGKGGSNGGVYAIDGTVVGAVQAGRIEIISTDAGAGVKMNGSMAANSGGITISSDGKIRLGKPRGNSGNAGGGSSYQAAAITSYDSLTVKSKGEIEKNANSYSFNDTTLEGKNVINTGRVDSDHGVKITTVKGDFINSGKLDAGTDMALTVKGGDMTNSGMVDAGRDLEMDVGGTIHNDGVKIVAGNTIDIRASGDLINENADMYALAGMTVKAANMEHRGISYLGSDGVLSVDVVNDLFNQNSLIQSAGTMGLSGGGQLNNDNGQIIGNSDILLTFAEIYNRSGKISALGGGKLSIFAPKGLINTDNGVIEGEGGITITAGQVINYQGNIIAEGALELAADDIDNRLGVLYAGRGVQISAANNLINDAGYIGSLEDVNITTANLYNDLGIIRANRDIRINAGNMYGVAGELTAGRDMALVSTNDLDVSGSVLTAGKNLDIEALRIAADYAALQATERLMAKASGTDGTLPAFSAQNSYILAGLADANGAVTEGNIALQSGGSMLVDGAVMQSTKSTSLSANNHITAVLLEAVAGEDVSLTSGGDTYAPYATVIASRNLTTNVGGALTLAGNGQVGAFIAQENIALNAGSIFSQGTLLHAGNALALNATTGGIDGSLTALMAKEITANAISHITNTDSLWQAENTIALITTQDLGITSDLRGSRFESPDIRFDIAGAADLSDALVGVTFANNNLAIISNLLDIRAGSLAADRAAVAANGSLVAETSTGSLSANDALFHANGGMEVNAATSAAFNRASISAGQTALSMKAGSGISVSDAMIEANDGLSLDAGVGALSGSGNGFIRMANLNSALTLSGESINLTAQRFETQNALEIITTSGNATLTGEVIVHGDLDANVAQSFINNGGDVTVLGALNATVGGNIENRDGGTLAIQEAINWALGGAFINGEGSLLTTPEDIAINAGSISNTGGSRIETAGALDLQGNTITNSGSFFAADNLTLSGGNATNSGGSIESGGNVTATMSGGFNNSSGGEILASRAVNITATSGSLTNQSGYIESGSGFDITLSADNIANKLGGKVLSGNNLQLTSTNSDAEANNLSNGGGGLYQAVGNITVSSQGRIGNDNGTYRAGGSITGNAVGVIHNIGGTMEAGNSISFNSQSGFDNDGGTLQAHAGDISITTGSRVGVYGLPIANFSGLVTVYNGVDNKDGTIIANNGNVTISTTHMGNMHGQISAGDDVTITAKNSSAAMLGLANYYGDIIAGRNLTVDSNDIVYNNFGTLSAGNNLNLTASIALDNGNSNAPTDNPGKIMAGGNLTINGLGKADVWNEVGGLISSKNGTVGITLDDGFVLNGGGKIQGIDVVIDANNTVNHLNALGPDALLALFAANPSLAALLGLNPNAPGGITAADITAAGLRITADGTVVGPDGTPLEEVIASALYAQSQGANGQYFHGKRYVKGTALNGVKGVAYAPGTGKSDAIIIANPSLLMLADPTTAAKIKADAKLISQALGTQDPSQLSGQIIAANSVTIKGAVDNRGGIIDAGNLVDIEGKNFLNDALILADGRVIQGKVTGENILIAANGKISNVGGKMEATNVLSLSGRTIINERVQNEKGQMVGKLKGDQVFADASGDLINRGGKIENNTSIYLHGGNIINESLYDGSGNLLSLAEIKGNDVRLIADNTIMNSGKINGVNSTLLMARNITNTSLRNTVYDSTTTLSQSNPHRDVATTTTGGTFHQAIAGSGLITGGNVSLIASETITNAGTLAADKTLLVMGKNVVNVASRAQETRGSRNLAFDEVYLDTGLMTGTDVIVSGTQGVLIDGGSVLATNNATVFSEKGDVVIAGARRTWTDHYGNRPFEYVGGVVAAGNETTIQGKTVSLLAAHAAAANDLTIIGENGVYATAIGDSFVTIEKKRSHHEYAQVFVSSLTSANGNINISSQNGTATLLGTQLNAGNKINIAAKDVVMDAVAQEEIHWRKKSWYKEAWDVGMDLNEMVARVHLTGYSDIPDTTIANTKISWNDHNVALTTMNAKNGINVYASNQVRGEGVLFNSDAGDISVYGKNGTTIDSEKVEKYIKEVGWDVKLSASALGGLISLDSAREADGDIGALADGAMQGNRTLNVLDNLKNVDGGLGLLNVVNAGFEANRLSNGNTGMYLFDVNVRAGTVNTEQTWTESFLSQINAGKNVMIGSEKDVNLLGGTAITAGKDIILAAGRDLNIAANEDTFKYRDSSSGVTVGVSSITGADYNPYVGFDTSKSKSDGTAYTNASLVAGGNIITSSGRDTNISGANLLAGNMLDITAARNLYAETLQNSTQSQSYAVSVTAGYNGSSGFSASYSEGDRKFADNQTTLIGQNGVRVNVGGTTMLDGTMIANVRPDGTDGSNLVLNTKDLIARNLTNTDDSWNVSVGGSFSGGNKQAVNSSKGGSTGTFGAGYQDVDGATYATVGKGTINVASGVDLSNLNRDITKTSEVFRAVSSQGEVTVPLPESVARPVGETLSTSTRFVLDNILPNPGNNWSFLGEPFEMLDGNREAMPDKNQPDVRYTLEEVRNNPNLLKGATGTFINGIMNSPEEAAINAGKQAPDGTAVIYNPTHGILWDLVEVGWNKTVGEFLGVPTASVDVDAEFARIIKERNGGAVLDPYGHSQGGHETYLMMLAAPKLFQGSWAQLSGAPVNVEKARDELRTITGVRPEIQINQGDFVGVILGANATDGMDAAEAMAKFPLLFTDKSPHSNYPCRTCTMPRPPFNPVTPQGQ